MVSFFGLKLGGGGATERKKKPDEPLGQDDFFDSIPLPMPPARPGTSNSHRDGSPYGKLAASSSLVDLRPSVPRPSTADPAAANEPRPGLVHPSTWPRTVQDGNHDNKPPARTKHGSSSSLSLSLAPAAAAGATRAGMSSPVQKKVRVNHLEVLSCRDAATAAIQAPARSPLGQFEFNLRQRQNASSPRIETVVLDYEDRSIVPIIEDASFSRPSSPAPNKSLPPTPSPCPQTPAADAGPPTRAKVPSNLREVIYQNDKAGAEKRQLLPTRQPPPPMTTMQPPQQVKQGPSSSLGGGRRRSIETDFVDPNPPVFSDQMPGTSRGEGGVLERPPPIGGDVRARSSSLLRGSPSSMPRPGAPMPPPGRSVPGGGRRPGPGPAPASAPAQGRPGPAFRPGPGPGPVPGFRPHGPLNGHAGPQGGSCQRPPEMPSPLRVRRGSGSKPQGDRVLPRMGPPGPRPGLGSAPRRLAPAGQDANAGGNAGNNSGTTYGPGQGPVLGSGPGPMLLRPSPIPAAPRTGSFASNDSSTEQLGPVSPPFDGQFQSVGGANWPPDKTGKPGLHAWRSGEMPSTPASPTFPLLNDAKDAETPKCIDQSRAEDRFSMTSSLYSSDSESSTPGKGEIRRDSNGWIVERGDSGGRATGLPVVENNFMGFDFGFSV